mmetsp:Transcript_17038/g.46711  ORF Transcript_17038/g.46711 Transcript_17038/m.46711 type:complete len:326 (+) Transcript_17038:66-1043(+)
MAVSSFLSCRLLVAAIAMNHLTTVCCAFGSILARHRLPPSAAAASVSFLPQRRHFITTTQLSASSPDDDDEDRSSGSPSAAAAGIDVSSDPRLYRVRLSRAPGIEWGTDLSFSFVYVREMDPSGEASMSKQVQVGDQLCEIKPINRATGAGDDNGKQAPINLVGAPFDFVMETFALLDKSVADLDMVFFRGTKEELKAAASGKDKAGDEVETITVMVYENKGTPQEVIHRLQAPVGVNIRQLCVDNGINVYQSVTRWTNCKGKQLCGTCIVNVSGGGVNTNRKSMDEASTLRENPETYRLSCVTFAYGDCVVETFPPINAAQWTR